MKRLALQRRIVGLTIAAALTFCGASTVSAQTSSLFNQGTTGGGNSASSGRGADLEISTTGAAEGVNTDFGSGFVGRSDNSGRFVGNQTVTQQQGFRTQSQFGNFGGSRANQFNSRNGNQFGASDARRQIRIRHVIGFSYKKRSTRVVQSAVSNRFAKLRRYPAISGIVIAMNDTGMLTLRGDVESESARRLAANLARLEPGVRKIQNDLTVTVPPKE